jgi:hypothetical protein
VADITQNGEANRLLVQIKLIAAISRVGAFACHGPRLTVKTATPPIIAASVLAPIVSRQSAPPDNAIKWELAEPIVKPLMRSETKNARSDLPQPAAIFMPTG